MDVSPKQLVSVAAALIPFLENDDANRALMGSHGVRRFRCCGLKRRSWVLAWKPVLRGIGRDHCCAPGWVIDQVDATRIVVRASEETDENVSPVDIYSLLKFQRSNQNTTVSQRPLVKVSYGTPR